MGGSRTVIGAILALVTGCAGAAGVAGTGQALAPVGLAGEADLVPPGYGTLAQAEFTLELVSGALQIQITPLAESVIRLAAPDTYQRLAGLSASAGASLRSRTRAETPLFLVSMFSRTRRFGRGFSRARRPRRVKRGPARSRSSRGWASRRSAVRSATTTGRR